MGTSGKYGGGSSVGLVPTWADNPSAPVGAPVGGGSPADGSGDGVGTATQSGGAGAPPLAPAIPGTAPSTGGSLRGARTLFNKFAGGGGSRQFRRAAGRYVRSGMGGSARATRAMGASRRAGGGLLTFGRDFAANGPVEALRGLNLEALAQSPIDQVFPQIVEALCPPGGTVDEAIARQAMLQAIAQLCEGFDGPISSLTADQLRQLFVDFVAGSIEGRILNDIGTNLVDLPQSVADLDALGQQVHDFIRNCVQNSLGGALQNLAAIQPAGVQQTVESIYQATFALIDAFADET